MNIICHKKLFDNIRKKSIIMTSIQQREQLQSQIWKIANEARGAVDGWDFKQFVLGTLFYRFIGENFYIEGGDESIDYASEKNIKGLFADVDTTSTRLGNTVENKNSRLAAVSKLISQLAMHKQATVNKIYDPAAGSGSLLLQAKRQFEDRIIEYSKKSLLLLRNSKELEDNCNTR